jgi:hypothetical protein
MTVHTPLRAAPMPRIQIDAGSTPQPVHGSIVSTVGITFATTLTDTATGCGFTH